jgi:hypothetical protein
MSFSPYCQLHVLIILTLYVSNKDFHHERINMKNNYKEKVFKAVKNSPIPIDTENVRVKAGIKSWVTGKTTLLELLCEGKICGQKTTKSWIFWVDNDE